MTLQASHVLRTRAVVICSYWPSPSSLARYPPFFKCRFVSTNASPKKSAKVLSSKTTTTPAAPVTTTDTRKPPPASEDKGKSMEEQLSEIEQLMNISHHYPKIDPWGQRVQTLDVQIPYAVSLNPFKSRDVTWITTWNRLKANILDNFKNATCMYHMASVDAFPGVDLSRSGRLSKLFRWPFLVFQSRSTKSDAWVAGIRAQALEAYKRVNKAVATRDEKIVKRLTLGTYQDATMRLIRKRSGSHVYLWRLHDEISSSSPSAQVLSMRAIDGYLAKDEPKLGNRLLVHALVKFDTKQSLQIYTKKGEVVSSRDPKRVVEYLVLEKRMWYDTPWLIREQIFETTGKHV